MDKCKFCGETLWRVTEHDEEGKRIRIWVDNLGTNFCPSVNNERLDHVALDDELAVAA